MKRFLSILLLLALALPAAARAGTTACFCYYNDTCVEFPGVSELTCLTTGALGTCAALSFTATSAWTDDTSGMTGDGLVTACSAKAAAYAADHPTGGAGASISPTVAFATPRLNVSIPGVNFATPTITDGQLSSTFLNTYISGIYRYLIGFAMTIAIVMMMIGGLQYVLGGTTGNVKGGQKRIQDAVEGFVLLLCVFIILFTINPETTMFRALEIKVIPPFPYEEEDDAVVGTTPGDLGTPTATNVSGANKSKISSELVTDVDAVAAALESKGYGMSISSALRTLQNQLDLITKNCQNPAGSATCNPKSGRPTTCILTGMNPANCPHTTGRALDVWGTKLGSTSQCITQDPCMADKAACRANPCQAALIAAMKAQGFCNLASEPWHFEKPKMSSTCN